MFEIFTNLFYITTYSNNTLQPADVENRKLKAKNILNIRSQLSSYNNFSSWAHSFQFLVD